MEMFLNRIRWGYNPPIDLAGTCGTVNRVKVYRLNDDGKWDDQGTGHVTVDYLEFTECHDNIMQRSEELGLFVFDEDDNETLLLHRISSEDIYRKQEDTIISWRDHEYSTELALSFQETTGCSYIWYGMRTTYAVCKEVCILVLSTVSETFHGVNSELRELPAVELSTLPLLLKTVAESSIADQMRVTELILHDHEFFRKLMDLFRICEDLENADGLHMIYKIVKGIILLNSPQIFEKIFGDELIMDIIGALEYEPEVAQVQHHRNFLNEHAIPIKDPLVLSKIHQTYRVGYIKDVVLPRVLDDAMIANLNSIIHGNNAIVVSLLKDDSTFIQELFARLRSSETSAESKKNLVSFLHEFCTLSKSLQTVQQLRLFRDLMNEGIFDIIAEVLQSEDKRLVLTATDILTLFLNQDPNLLRSYVIRQEGIPLLGLLVEGMLTDFGEDMHCQFLEILRSLLDSYTLSGSQRDPIIEIFYEKHLGQLINVITASCPMEDATPSTSKPAVSGITVEKQTCAKPEILSNICELLCFCVLHHPYRIKYSFILVYELCCKPMPISNCNMGKSVLSFLHRCNFVLNNVIERVLYLTRRREKYLVVAAVRFVRTLISQNDEHLINHFVENDLLRPIVDAFVANGTRYNLLNSAVLELFEYLRKENIKSLLKYVVETFWDQTKSTSGVLDPRKRIDERALEKEEEDYFNEDSDEEDTASVCISNPEKGEAQVPLSNGVGASYPLLRSGGLVDYDDDEDDEDYKPPPRKQPEPTDGDEGIVDTSRLKRKLGSKEENEVTKKHRSDKSSKPKDSVFAASCTTISQAVVPSKKAASMYINPRAQDSAKRNDEENYQDDDPATAISSDTPDNNSTAAVDSHEKELAPPRNCSDCSHNAAENRQLGGDERSLIPPKSSPEMTVNGS
ncbi:Serine/threonine-protein phosphatase 4 regulatory subunit 3-like, central domain [Dillenia turbinata]|uniref:Serine/threonine-protein phosphatase 4 regulatory subunit 3-like, central domain n=1 Tax=Dillenia turbinata TaxID=194707 RepID=A0AAN8VMV0_9MAGN